MEHLIDKLDQITDTQKLSNPEIWKSPIFRGVTLPDLHIACHEAKNISEHQKAVEIFKMLLKSLTKFIRQDTRREIEMIHSLLYFRSLLRYHVFSSDNQAVQIYPPEISERLDSILKDKDDYREVPFSTIYPAFKGEFGPNNWATQVYAILKKMFGEENIKNKKILDLAVGGGKDILELIKQGINVVGNDYDPAFIQQASQLLKSNGQTAKIIKSDWKELTKNHGREKYDGAYLIGNSLTYLSEKSDRELALKEIYDSLKPGSILILDSRNYDKMLDNKDWILRNPQNFQFMYMSVYQGDHVLSHPVNISDRLIKMEYIDPKNKQRSYLDLYPFREAELDALVKKCGFEIKEKSYDCGGFLSPEKKGHYDFILYTLQKPH